MPSDTPRVLFLCTGNYYRSRFAERLFDHLAVLRGSRWRAFSRGLRPSPRNVGPLSVHARAGLERLGIPVEEDPPPPVRLELRDLEAAGHVVAVKQEEHLPLMLEHFPAWADRIEYWHVHDLDRATSEVALPGLASQVEELLERLEGRRGDSLPGADEASARPG